jgi:hypothetical protein
MVWHENGSATHGGFIGFIVHSVVRFFQFIFAITILALYGVDITNQRNANGHADGRWVYGLVVALLSAITALIFMVPFFKTYKAFGWDVLLLYVFAHYIFRDVGPWLTVFKSFFWVIVFGIFGHLYIPTSPYNDSRERSAVWIDLINMLLWLISALFGLLMFFRSRNGKSLHTGRATV